MLSTVQNFSNIPFSNCSQAGLLVSYCIYCLDFTLHVLGVISVHVLMDLDAALF